MKTIGIITEYNPFHNGHLYQINKIKEMTGAEHVVVVMSGDFVQRGVPAWTDKYLRSEMALASGISLVFELPVCYATASAEQFAMAGVSLLSSLSFVDGICFGCECDNLALLQKIADFLAVPPESFYEQVTVFTSQGLSFPAARQKALETVFPNECLDNPDLLSSPNNILAIEYLKALRVLNSTLRPYAIRRCDSGYHSDSLESSFASATAIRKQSLTGNDTMTDFFSIAGKVMPDAVVSLLRQEKNRFPVTEDDFSVLLYYCLQNHFQKTDSAANTATILDMTPELYYRIRNCLADFDTYSSFTGLLKTKQYTHSRISRVLLHLLLDIHEESVSYPLANPLTPQHTKNADGQFFFPVVPYARLLGFQKKASYLLREESSIPIITKPADGLAQIQNFDFADSILAYAGSFGKPVDAYVNYACRLYEKDIMAANLYSQVQSRKYQLKLPDEYRQKPVIL